MQSSKEKQEEVREPSSVINEKRDGNHRMEKTRDLFKKIGDTKETFYAKMDTIKDRNGMDIREAEDIKKTWQEHTEELYKKDLHDPDNHDGVITHLEPDTLESEVKWTLGNTTTNKASGGDGIPVELFQKVMLLKWCTQYASKFGKLSSGHRTGKSQFSFQSQRMFKLSHSCTHLTC